jgi:hypothetical protein
MRFQISTPDDGKSAVDQQTRQVWGDKVRRDGEAQRYVGREGAHETRVRAQSSSTPLCQRLNVIMTRWLGLIQIARNHYRPELHYMRGPGPKWYAKHQNPARRAAARGD